MCSFLQFVRTILINKSDELLRGALNESSLVIPTFLSSFLGLSGNSVFTAVGNRRLEALSAPFFSTTPLWVPAFMVSRAG